MFQLLGLGIDQDEDHPYEESWLLGIGAYTSVTHDANGKSCHGHGAGHGALVKGEKTAVPKGVGSNCDVTEGFFMESFKKEIPIQFTNALGKG